MIKTFFCKILPIILTMFSFVNFNYTFANNLYEISHEENINISVYEKITPRIVSIEANTPIGMSSGTGCIIDEKGLILTSLHVVKNAGTIEVTTQSGEVYLAKIFSILKDNNDLAIIKIEPKEKLSVVTFGNSSNVKVGQRVLTIGNPFGFKGTLTTGIISMIDYTKNKIQTDASINPGCSGGPLLNIKGEVIGINQSIYNPDNDRSNIGIGFAVPINEAKKFINSTMQKMASSK